MHKMIIGIGACDLNFGIGNKNELPWPRLKEDLKRFRKITEGSVIVMGRKTWESLGKKPLPNRIHLVVSNTLTTLSDCDEFGVFFTTPKDMYVYLANCVKYNVKIFVIGGCGVWDLLMPYMDAFYLTRVLDTFECDIQLDVKYMERCMPRRKMLSSIKTDIKSGVKYYFEVWTRKMI